MARILIAEDEADLADVWRRALELEGYTVDVALDGEEAVGKLEANENAYDLVITDLRMPYKGGLVVTGMSRLHQPNAKVIVVSGHYAKIKSVDMLAVAENLGAYRSLCKPIDIDVFLETVSDILNGAA